MTWPSSVAVTSGQTSGVSTAINAIRSDLSGANFSVTKSADQSVTSSTTLVNDSELSYTVASTGTFNFTIELAGLSATDAAGDLKVAMAFPTGTCNWRVTGLNIGLASGTSGTAKMAVNLGATSGTTSTNLGVSSAGVPVTIRGQLTATATGTLQFMFAQYASNASATTIKAGSFMEVRQVA